MFLFQCFKISDPWLFFWGDKSTLQLETHTEYSVYRGKNSRESLRNSVHWFSKEKNTVQWEVYIVTTGFALRPSTF